MFLLLFFFSSKISVYLFLLMCHCIYTYHVLINRIIRKRFPQIRRPLAAKIASSPKYKNEKRNNRPPRIFEFKGKTLIISGLLLYDSDSWDIRLHQLIFISIKIE